MCIHNDTSNMVNSCIKAEAVMVRKQSENYPFLEKKRKKKFFKYLFPKVELQCAQRSMATFTRVLALKQCLLYAYRIALQLL